MTTMPHKGEPTPALLNRVADILLRRVGLHLGNDRRSDLLLAVRNRVTALQLPSAEAYEACLADDADHTEFAALVDEVTVGETYFFRVRSFFDVFRTRVLPPSSCANAQRVTPCASGVPPAHLARSPTASQ